MEIYMPTIMLGMIMARGAAAVGFGLMMRFIAQEPALKYWLAFKLLGTLSFLVLYFEHYLPQPHSVYATNILGVYAYALAWIGIRIFNHRKPIWWFATAFPIVMLLPVTWFIFMDPSPGLRVLVAGSAFFILSLLCGVEHFRGEANNPRSEAIQRFVGSLFFIQAVVWMLLNLHLIADSLEFLKLVPHTQSTADVFDERFTIPRSFWIVVLFTEIVYPIGIVAMVYERLNGKMDKTMGRLKQLLDEQQKFSLMLSHEFRTPLAAIGRTANYLERTAVSLKKDDLIRLSNIRKRVKDLSGLVDTFLDDAAKRSAYDDFRVVPIETAELWRLVEDAVKQDRGDTEFQRLQATLPAGPCVFLGHAPSLASALGTLVDNALKYSPGNTQVLVKVSATEESVTIAVSDSGVGIPQADLQHIPQRFYRAENVRNEPGSGLGLSMASWVAEQHGGQLDLESKEGEGTTVRLILPRST